MTELFSYSILNKYFCWHLAPHLIQWVFSSHFPFLSFKQEPPQNRTRSRPSAFNQSQGKAAGMPLPLHTDIQLQSTSSSLPFLSPCHDPAILGTGVNCSVLQCGIKISPFGLSQNMVGRRLQLTRAAAAPSLLPC